MFEAQKFEIDPTLFSTKAVGVLYGILRSKLNLLLTGKWSFSISFSLLKLTSLRNKRFLLKFLAKTSYILRPIPKFLICQKCVYPTKFLPSHSIQVVSHSSSEGMYNNTIKGRTPSRFIRKEPMNDI